MNGRTTAGVNAGMRFLAGYMDGMKERQEKQKRDAIQNTIMNIGRQGNMDYTIKYDSKGGYSVTLKPRKAGEVEFPMPAGAQITRGTVGKPPQYRIPSAMPWQEKAAEMGATITMAPGLAPAQAERGAMELCSNHHS